MKYSIILMVFIFSIFTIPSCQNDCEMSNDPVCLETPPTDELCLAAFERWFYVEATSQCELIGYSGCSQKGFATEEACTSCGCN